MGGVPMSEMLSYDTRREPRPTIWLHYVSRVSGLLPMFVGTLIFFTFLITRWRPCVGLGLLTIVGGTCLAFIGAVCACVYLYQASRASDEEKNIARRRAFFSLAIIIANFPAALVMAWLSLGLLKMDGGGLGS
jgi:hypothetical protein